MPKNEPEVIERDPDESRNFSAFWTRIEDGQWDQDTTAAWTDLISDIREVQQGQGGKPSGTMTFEVNFQLVDGLMEIRAKFSVKKPKRARVRSVYWVTQANTLTGRNPFQRNLPFGVRDVSTNTKVRDAG
jgi:hypothetical protein